MNEELKNKLIAALQAKGLDKGMADFLSVSEESEIEGVVAKLQAQLQPKTLTKDEKIKDPEVQSEIDRRVTDALKKEKEKNPNPDPPTPKPEEMPAWAKDLAETNKKLLEKVESIESGKTIESKKAEAQAKLKASTVINDKFKEKWLNRIDVTSETSVEDQIKGLEAEFTEWQKDITDGLDLSGALPTSNPTGKASESEVDALLEGMVPTT